MTVAAELLDKLLLTGQVPFATAMLLEELVQRNPTWAKGLLRDVLKFMSEQEASFGLSLDYVLALDFAKEQGWSIEWEEDDQSSDEGTAQIGCVVWDRERVTWEKRSSLASLWAIDADAASSFRRYTEAALAHEAVANHLGTEILWEGRQSQADEILAAYLREHLEPA